MEAPALPFVGRGRELPYVVRTFQDRLVKKLAEIEAPG